MNINSLFCRLCHSRIACLAAIALATLALSKLSIAGDIHDASRVGDLAEVKALLKDNPTLASSKDHDGWTPLHYAAKFGHKDVAERPLANHANVNAEDNDGETPLMYATTRGTGTWRSFSAGMAATKVEHLAACPPLLPRR